MPSPVAATKMIGHGACDALITPPARRNATTPVATISSHGTVPVRKKSKAFPPLSPNPSIETRNHFRNVPKIRNPRAPPTISQSETLNLLRSTAPPGARSAAGLRS